MSEKHSQWKDKMQDAFSTVQQELKKTTDIGVKMFSASKTNSCLKDAYAQLGKVVAQEIKQKKLELDNCEIDELLVRIEDCEKNLSSLEDEVQDIRFSTKK